MNKLSLIELKHDLQNLETKLTRDHGLTLDYPGAFRLFRLLSECRDLVEENLKEAA